jgi:LysM repeat protein
MQRGVTGELTAFSLYLRTGRRVVPPAVEVKFNPWHDEENGRFTFAGQGRYFGAGGSGGASGPKDYRDDDGLPDRSRNRVDHPDNHNIHIMQPGDSLSRLAARRKGLTARGLAWLNGQSVDQPLKIGQPIKLPNQAYLDAGRDAKNRFLDLAHYMERHGGKLPPNSAKPPTLESQILDTDWKRETKNGYDFHIDVAARGRKIFGSLSLAEKVARSRRNQAEAGKPDRLVSDDGGHYIAARFNGPRDSFNHFAQDASFNRGAYRVMEDKWAGELRAGHKVFVVIEPLYHGASKRPYQLNVSWEVDGQRASQKFRNEAKGKIGGKR